jgi:CheY-like chemotaxis protein
MDASKYILMLEADDDDRFITSSTIEELGINVDVRFAFDSTELFTQLENQEKPFLILLNFNSRPLSALQILPQLKRGPYQNIPVVVLGENISDSFVRDCYMQGAASFVMKPGSMSETKNKISTFFDYWLNVAE